MDKNIPSLPREGAFRRWAMKYRRFPDSSFETDSTWILSGSQSDFLTLEHSTVRHLVSDPVEVGERLRISISREEVQYLRDFFSNILDGIEPPQRKDVLWLEPINNSRKD